MQNATGSMIYFVIATTIILLLLMLFIVSILFIYQKKQNSYQVELASINVEFEKNLLNSQLEIQEEILQNISRELHDNICLTLTLAKLNLVTLTPHNRHENLDRINSSIELLSKSISELSDMSHSMNSQLLEDFGLIKALEIESEKMKKPGLFKTSFIVEGESVFMSSEKELVIFRIIQEAFNNVLKHSAAENVFLQLYYNESHLEAIVKDDGIGFSIEQVKLNGKLKLHSGLTNIKKRAELINGNCTVTSHVNKGTTIHLSIPY